MVAYHFKPRQSPYALPDRNSYCIYWKQISELTLSRGSRHIPYQIEAVTAFSSFFYRRAYIAGEPKLSVFRM